MARVTKTAFGYEFSGLNPSAMRLVNEFQRMLPRLCEPSAEPSYRFIRLGNPEQTGWLERLVADVRRLDPEPARPAPVFKRHHVARD